MHHGESVCHGEAVYHGEIVYHAEDMYQAEVMIVRLNNMDMKRSKEEDPREKCTFKGVSTITKFTSSAIPIQGRTHTS